MKKCIGILTAGGDSPGLNAAIRGIGKAAINDYQMKVIGFKDGFKGMVENRFMVLENHCLSGILTQGGTMLGTSRFKPHKMPMGDQVLDMTQVVIDNYHKNSLDALICLGGGGTQKNAFKLHKAGLNIITLPKTIDNDVFGTDFTFGFDTAMGIAVEAIDRLHSTAHSHHRIIVVEIMGHNTGWLALGAGLAGGADAILIPEIPYDVEFVADSILQRKKSGKSFSIVAVAEGAISKDLYLMKEAIVENLEKAENKEDKKRMKDEIQEIEVLRTGHTYRLSSKLEAFTGLESRVTILGHLQRGGTPSAADRNLATLLGTEAAKAVNDKKFGIMIGIKDGLPKYFQLEDIVGQRKNVPLDHPWLNSAKRLNICLGAKV